MPGTQTPDLAIIIPAAEWGAFCHRIGNLEVLMTGVVNYLALNDDLAEVGYPADPWPPEAANANVPADPGNIVPAWVLPMVRLARATGGDLGEAWAALPDALPAGVRMPGEREAARTLIALGLT